MIERADEPRASISAEIHSESQFSKFLTAIRSAKFETEVVAKHIPTLEGGDGKEKREKLNITFTNLASLIDSGLYQRVLSKVTPHLFYGNQFECLDEMIGQDLSLVLPTANIEKPIAPNFFLELTGPEVHQNMANGYPLYYGALRERGQIALASWGYDKLVLMAQLIQYPAPISLDAQILPYRRRTSSDPRTSD
ncbi:hypothetical protein EV44_g3074 [Erysiphe necator]|uniref:Uncharacterized protein n=1 Tax=Uncinula necator TaxID=52586 RepID=A0A0B1P918_UNCNE|nr:hypothetical protein EV44_g3074 [Erysiphe necator]